MKSSRKLFCSASRLLLPRRLLLVRHGQSIANLDPDVYKHTPDWRIRLTAFGEEEARRCGAEIKQEIGDEKLSLYVSPYIRAKQTLAEIRNQFAPLQIIGEKEDERLREQEMGNYQVNMEEKMKRRAEFGRFFYRFSNGECGADVCDRVSLFIDYLFRERRGQSAIETDECSSMQQEFKDSNIVIVTHGLTMRLFVARWYKLPLEVFDKMRNPLNCGIARMIRDDTTGRLVLRNPAVFGLNEGEGIKFDGTDNNRWYDDHLLNIRNPGP